MEYLLSIGFRETNNYISVKNSLYCNSYTWLCNNFVNWPNCKQLLYKGKALNTIIIMKLCLLHF